VEVLINYPEFGKGILEQAAILSGRIDLTLTWSDTKWLRDKWKKNHMIKGILSVEDAKMAKARGADAIVIFNHGRRQLDFASSIIAVLPDISELLAEIIAFSLIVVFVGAVKLQLHWREAQTLFC